MGRGDFLTLIGGVFFSVHIVLLDRFGREKDPILLTIMQFLSAGICAVVASVFTEIPFSLSEISFETWLRISYLFLFCTTIAVLLQTVGQKYASPMSVGIILSFESVFGVVFSVAFYGEQLTLKVLIGFLLIFGAVFLSEIRFKKDKIKLTSLKKAHIIKSSGR